MKANSKQMTANHRRDIILDLLEHLLDCSCL